MNFAYLHRLTSGATRSFVIGVLASVLSPVPMTVNAQVAMAVPQTPAPMKDQHSAASPSPLQELVREVELSNPEIAASLHMWQAATNVPKQASSLPDTEITVQQISVGSPRPFAGFSNSDFAYVGIGASQDLPYPGKRGLRSEVAEREADSIRAQSAGVRSQAIETLKLVYFQLAYLQQTLPILERNGQILSQIQQVAESRYRVGQGNQQDVLRAQWQRTKLLQEVAMHHQQEEQLEAQMKQVLSRAQGSPDIVPEPLSPTAPTRSDAELLDRVRDQNPHTFGSETFGSETLTPNLSSLMLNNYLAAQILAATELPMTAMTHLSL